MTKEHDDIAHMAQLVLNHHRVGRDREDAPVYITDLDTLVRDAHKVLWRIHPPATEAERLSFLVTTVAAIDRRTETIVSVADDLATAVATLGTDAQAAADRVTADLAALRQQLADAQQALTDAIAAGSADAATLTSVLDNVTAADALVNSIDAATP